MKPQQNFYKNTVSYQFHGIDAKKAYQQAGQAAAIYIGNKEKKLPAVYFKILIGPQAEASFASFGVPVSNGINPDAVMIEGGRLVDNLLLLSDDVAKYFSPLQLEQYRSAVEADITNMLAGILAEAKYKAHLNKTPFDIGLFTAESLADYCEEDEWATICEYTQLYKEDRNRKLNRLVTLAFDFVSKPSYWRAISKLARFIQSKIMDAISCEEVASIIGPYAMDIPQPPIINWPQEEEAPDLTGLYG